MAHDPLNTDEMTGERAKRRPDMDTAFLTGCLTIAILSIIVYIVTIWPFFVMEANTREQLVNIFLLGGLPALILGLIAVRVLGLSGATGFVGGVFASSVYIFLQIDMLALGNLKPTEELPGTDYPEAWAWLVPLLWSLVSVTLTLLLLKRSEYEDVR